MRVLYSSELNEIVAYYKEAKADPFDEDDLFAKALLCSTNIILPKLIFFGKNVKIADKLPVYVRNVVSTEEAFYMVPITSPSVVRGFLFRTVKTKNFRIVSDGKPYFYGMHRFEDFRYGNPIFLSEGLKDAEAIAKFYKYSLAVLGNHISMTQKEVLNRMSDRLFFVADNDKWGRHNEYFNKKAGAVVLFPPTKDPGDYFEDSYKGIVGSYLKETISLLAGGVVA